jgi:ATP-dependent exoDNAse (exonuclease V) alpha subunit
MERYIKEKTPKKTMKFDPLKFDKNSQEITICEGMPIIARINHRKLDIINNESFTISKIKDDAVYVSNEVKKDIEIPVEKFNRFFYLAFCITIHKSQGATFREKYTIHEWNKQCRKMKYVAISRATDEKNVQIVP